MLSAEALHEEREALIAEIHQAFAQVSRKDGISWSESIMIDESGTQDERHLAAKIDHDTSWLGLIHDPSWNPEPGTGGWNFLDPIGFRYYLAAAMVRSVERGVDEGIVAQLKLPEKFFRNHTLHRWSALTEPQRLCVKRFLHYMAVLIGDSEPGGNDWQKALNSYWDGALGA